MPPESLLETLAWRGLLHQHTEGLTAALESGPVRAYCGFDPTAPSLHVGSLVPIMGLVHLQRAGHQPVALVGGGTGLIGDPSGKRSERPLHEASAVRANTQAIRTQLERFLDVAGPHGLLVRDNAAWLGPLGAIALLRDVGKHFTVNYMLAKESVAARLEAGISYTEFSYMLLQAYDFLELYRSGVTVQLGGSDQWGNITAGVELIRRAAGGEAHGLTLPLVTTASGTKFGKTEEGAVWLDAARTSPYRFYQFWLNVEDRDVGRYLRYFTLVGRTAIEALDAETAAHPERRAAQQVLARDVTARVHGEEAARTAAELSALLFGGGDVTALSRAALDALTEEVPSARVPRPPGGTLDVLDLAVATGRASSRGAARRLLQQGGLSVNGRRLDAEQREVGMEELLHGEYLLLRRGAREWAVVRVGGTEAGAAREA